VAGSACADLLYVRTTLEYFTLVMFWFLAIGVILRILSMATGRYTEPTTIGIYAADTVISATLAIWAAFCVWYI